MSWWHEQDWAVAEGPVSGTSDNAQVIISHASGLGGDIVNPEWPVLLIAKAVYKDAGLDTEAMANLEDKIDEMTIETDQGMLIAKVTVLDTSCFRDHLIYLKQDTDMDDFQKALQETCPAAEFKFQVHNDPRWQGYNDVCKMSG